jgi:hypothetical protein
MIPNPLDDAFFGPRTPENLRHAIEFLEVAVDAQAHRRTYWGNFNLPYTRSMLGEIKKELKMLESGWTVVKRK